MKSKARALLKKGERAFIKYSPELAIGFGVAGLITAGVMAVKATPKALSKIEDKKSLNESVFSARNNTIESVQVELTKLEIVKTCWKVYAPSVILATLSTVLIINGNAIKSKRTAALATAYKISETALSEYKDMVIETIGEKKEKAIQEKISTKKVENTPVSNQVIITEKGNTLCLESLGGRYFRSNYDTIKKVENLLNMDLRNEYYVSLNTLYSYLNLEQTDFGSYLGWNIDRDGYVTIEIDSVLSPSGEPALAMRFSKMPQYDFDKFVY